LWLRGVPVRWLTEIATWNPPTDFSDLQLRGPYRLWHHTHTFAADRDGTRMRDVVRYALPLGPLGRVAHACFVRRDLDEIFAYRAAKVGALLGATDGRG
jgi:ligand-binding SRPBCC domain-containing protein